MPFLKLFAHAVKLDLLAINMSQLTNSIKYY